jgi:hypothetical protein
MLFGSCSQAGRSLSSPASRTALAAELVAGETPAELSGLTTSAALLGKYETPKSPATINETIVAKPPRRFTGCFPNPKQI